MRELKALVSIIVPVYNGEKTIRRCVESLFKQKYPNIEVIVVNDGSVDQTASTLQELCVEHDQLRCISVGNAGVSNARNIGIQYSHGDMIAFVDADDYVSTNIVMDLMTANPSGDADIIIGGIAMVDQASKELSELQVVKSCVILDSGEAKQLAEATVTGKLPGVRFCETESLGYCFGKLYNRRLLVKKIQFNTDVSIREDALFNLSAILNAKKIVLTPAVGYNYVLHAETATSTYNPKLNKSFQILQAQIHEYFREYHIAENSFYYSCVKSYMFWLKLTSLNPGSPLSRKNKKKLIIESFDNETWSEGIDKVDYSMLELPYKILVFAYRRRITELIFTLRALVSIKGLIKSMVRR